MLLDGLAFLDSSTAENLAVQRGNELPTTGNNVGELFYLIGTGLHIYDGATWALIGGAVVPYDLAVSSSGKLASSAIVLNLTAVRPFELSAGLTTSRASAGVASTDVATLVIAKNGTQIGTITFTSSTTGVFSFTNAVSFAVDDKLSITAPSTADETLSDVSITLAATLL